MPVGKKRKANASIKAIARLKKAKTAYCAPGSKTKKADVRKKGEAVIKAMKATAKRNGKSLAVAERKAEKLVKKILDKACSTTAAKPKKRKTSKRKKKY